MSRRPPMTADEARENINAMMAATKPEPRRRLITLALGPLGNLSEEARAIYRAALEKDAA